MEYSAQSPVLSSSSKDDLFGSDSEPEETPNDLKPISDNLSDIQDIQDNINIEGYGNYDEKEPETPDIVIKSSIIEPGAPTPRNPNLFLTKIPFFMGYDPKPFDRDAYIPITNSENDDVDIQDDDMRLQVENIIRWRNNPMNPIKKESNARMVRWSDGSFSLLIGEELFEVATNDISEQNQYALLSHPNEALFQTHARFLKSATFRPHSTHSLAHKKLTMAIAQKHRKVNRMKNHVTTQDPEQIRIAAEKAENERFKAAKRLEAKRRSAFEAQYNQDYDLQQDSEEEQTEAMYRKGNSSIMRNLDEYELETGFVVEDEEDSEDEVRQQRLMEAKRKTDVNDESELVSDTASNLETEDKDKSRKGKKMRIESDDEDEEEDAQVQFILDLFGDFQLTRQMSRENLKSSVANLSTSKSNLASTSANFKSGSLRNIPKASNTLPAAITEPTITPAQNAITYENTYKLRPDKKFPAEPVKRLVEATLLKHLTKVKYDFETIPELTKAISTDILEQVKQMGYDRYKYVAHVEIGEFKGQGIKCGSRAIWDTTTDTFASGSFRNATIFGVAMVFGVYFE